MTVRATGEQNREAHVNSALVIIQHHSIGAAAARLRVHPRTLRIYEAEGFLAPYRHSNMRRYSEADLALITAVRFLTQERGLNLAGVRILFGLVAEGRIAGNDIDPALKGLEGLLAVAALSSTTNQEAKRD